jgi:hypothetical protein
MKFINEKIIKKSTRIKQKSLKQKELYEEKAILILSSIIYKSIKN